MNAPQTLAQKLIARAAGRSSVQVGEVVTCAVDLAMFHDSSGPRRLRPMLEELGAEIWDRNKVVLVLDHYVPAQDSDAQQIVHFRGVGFRRQLASEAVSVRPQPTPMRISGRMKPDRNSPVAAPMATVGSASGEDSGATIASRRPKRCSSASSRRGRSAISRESEIDTSCIARASASRRVTVTRPIPSFSAMARSCSVVRSARS